MKRLWIIGLMMLMPLTLSAANITARTDGAVTGTGTLSIPSGVLGGILISADGSNTVTVLVYLNDSSGKQVFDLTTKSPALIIGPIYLEGKNTIYYSVSGTNGAAQFYQWNQ